MPFFSTIRNFITRSNPLESPSVNLSSPAVWAWINGGNTTESGEIVNELSAMQSITVLACVKLIAESVASLPLKLYERVDRGRTEAFSNPLHDILCVQPNPEMSAFTFWETLAGCLALSGNCYAEIVRNGAGQVAALYPLHPLKTGAYRDAETKVLAFKTSDGMPSGCERIIAAANMLHCPLFSFDGLKGLSPVQNAAQAIGLSRAAEKYGARFFGNGSRPGGLLTPEGNPDEIQMTQARESWMSTQGGVNQGKTAVLPGGWKYTPIGLSPEESQFLSTRKFQREDIAALFGVAPHKVGSTERLSNANSEQQSLSFIQDTIRPYLTRFELEITRKLLPNIGRNAGKFFVQFDVRSRIAGDFETQMKGFALGRQWGWLTQNMILEAMGQNPIGPEGDITLTPLNMTNAKTLLNPPATAPSDPAPVSATRSLEQITTMYTSLLTDSVGRLTARNKRDYDAVSTTFGAVLTSFADTITIAARSQFSLPVAWNAPTERILRDCFKGIEKRSATWTVTNQAESSAVELVKSLRSIHLNIYREAGSAIAEQELNELK